VRAGGIRKFLGVAGRIVLALLAAVAVITLVGMRNAQSDPVVRTASVRMAGLPAGTPPLRVVLLSDVHLGNRGMEPARLTQIANRVSAERPDLILIAGDFVTGDNPDGAAERAAGLTVPLSRLHASLGVFAVLGNHDHWTAPEAVRAALAKARIIVLENQAVRREAFAIVGVGDRFSGHDDIARSVAAADGIGGVPIVFTHSPDIVADLPDRFPLLLAGHTHCGQVVLPLVGPLVMYARGRRLYDPRYRCGRIDDAHRVTFVTAGIGSGTVPVRINAMPDWWMITVHP
jgi:predicted MPP superfamily phosphohydrolase